MPRKLVTFRTSDVAFVKSLIKSGYGEVGRLWTTYMYGYFPVIRQSSTRAEAYRWKIRFATELPRS
jgi:hypothetical protein